MTFEDLSDIQVMRITRKRIQHLIKRLRIRRIRSKQAITAFTDIKSACIKLGAWDKSI